MVQKKNWTKIEADLRGKGACVHLVALSFSILHYSAFSSHPPPVYFFALPTILLNDLSADQFISCHFTSHILQQSCFFLQSDNFPPAKSNIAVECWPIMQPNLCPLPFEIPTSVLNVCIESCSPKSVHQDLHTGGSVAFLCKQLRLCEFSWQLLVKGAALCNPTYPSITFKCLEMSARAQNGSWRSFNFFSPAGYIDPILEASIVEKSASLNAWVRNWLPLIYKKPLQWKHKMAPQCIEESSCVFTSQTQKVLLTSVWWVAIILQLSLLSTCRNWAISF